MKMMASHWGHYYWGHGCTDWNILWLRLDYRNGCKALWQGLLQIILSQCSSQFLPSLTCFHSFSGIRGFVSLGICCCVAGCIVPRCCKDCKGQAVQAPCRWRQCNPNDVRNHTPSDIASHPRRPESSEAAVLETQILPPLKHSLVATWPYHQLVWFW